MRREGAKNQKPPPIPVNTGAEIPELVVDRKVLDFRVPEELATLALRRGRGNPTGDSRPFLPGQHFHVYLIAYGAFRFAHEFIRATPRLASGLSGYHFAALACIALGGAGYWKRARALRR